MPAAFKFPMSKLLRGPRALSVLAFLAACSGPGGCADKQISSVVPAAPTPRPGYVGDDTKVERAKMTFNSPEAAATYDTLNACLKRTEEGFYAYPLRTIGNFVNVEWCRGKGAHINCAGGDTRKGAGAAWTSLEVLHHTETWPQVFGLTFSVADVPKQDGVGVTFSWSKGGKRIVGEGMHLGFREVAKGKVTRTVGVSMLDEFEVGEDSLVVNAVGDTAMLYARLRESPESLRAEVEGRLNALEKKVHDALDADTPRKCVYGEYNGDGIAPDCVERVPLSAADKDKARKQLADRLTSERALLASHYQTMHARFLEVLPDRCWSPSAAQP